MHAADSALSLGELSFRDGGVSDLETTFGLSERAMHDSATRGGILAPGQ